jgi:hypothetical protein
MIVELRLEKRTVTSDLSKTISTCTIWLATAMIMTFGLFRMSNGDFIFYMVLSAIIIGGAAGATATIWKPSTTNPPSTPPT